MLRKIIKKVSKDLDVDEKVVKLVLQSQYKFIINKVKEYSKDSEKNSFCVTTLGKFYINERDKKDKASV